MTIVNDLAMLREMNIHCEIIAPHHIDDPELFLYEMRNGFKYFLVKGDIHKIARYLQDAVMCEYEFNAE